MIAKAKYVGTTNSDYTNNKEYFILGFGDGAFVVRRDTGLIVGEGYADLNNPALWQLISITAVGPIQIYP